MIADRALGRLLDGSRPLSADDAALRGFWWRCGLAAVLAAPYGATIGLWTSPRLAAYAAIKLPLVMLVTAMLTLVACWVIARLMGWAPSARRRRARRRD